MKIRGFTLAEIMIALAIIGIITAILLPVAMQSVPNDNVMKFKKGHATLFKVINELVTSDKYYKDGDLGIKPDGVIIDGTHDDDDKYFCECFADIISIKSKNCENTDLICGWQDLDALSIEEAKLGVDAVCKENKKEIGIITSDDIVFYESVPQITFGMSMAQAQGIGGYENPSDSPRRNFGEYIINGFDVIYKIFCMDIDGINQGEDPFGYGIRADGKILTGARADEWLQKDIQSKE